MPVLSEIQGFFGGAGEEVDIISGDPVLPLGPPSQRRSSVFDFDTSNMTLAISEGTVPQDGSVTNPNAFGSALVAIPKALGLEGQ